MKPIRIGMIGCGWFGNRHLDYLLTRDDVQVTALATPNQEKMLKTALEEPERLSEIGYLLQMITQKDIIPDEFRELYETFKKTLRLK